MEAKIVKRVTALNFVKLFVSFCRFSLRMKSEEHLLYKSPLELMKQMISGNSVIAFSGWKIVCHVTLWHLNDNWYECGTMWTDPVFRKQRLAVRVMKQLLKNNQGKFMMLTSTNTVSQRLAISVGFQSAKFSDLPHETHIETCICDVEKTGYEDPLKCLIKDNQCVCFVKLAK